MTLSDDDQPSLRSARTSHTADPAVVANQCRSSVCERVALEPGHATHGHRSRPHWFGRPVFPRFAFFAFTLVLGDLAFRCFSRTLPDAVLGPAFRRGASSPVHPWPGPHAARGRPQTPRDAPLDLNEGHWSHVGPRCTRAWVASQRRSAVGRETRGSGSSNCWLGYGRSRSRKSPERVCPRGAAGRSRGRRSTSCSRLERPKWP
jgi:hypothetical protein